MRQVLALAVVVPLTAVRSEGLLLVPVIVFGIVLVSLTSATRSRGAYLKDALGELWRFRFTLLILPLGLAALLLAEEATGRSPKAALGRYADTLRGYPFGPTLRWSLYQLVDLEIYLVVIPLVPALLVVGALLGRSAVPRPERALAAAAAPAVTLFILAAGATSQGAQGGGSPINYVALPANLHDRYCFYVAPLFLIFFLAWMGRRRDYSNRVLLPMLLAAAALPLSLPYASVHSNADFDSLALLPWNNKLIANRNVHYGMAVAAGLLVLTLIPRRRTLALLQVGLVAALLWVVGLVAQHEVALASIHVPTSHLRSRSWIDVVVPHGQAVGIVWAPQTGWPLATFVRQEQALWRAEFLNASVTRVFYVGAPMNYDLPETRIALRGGKLVLPPGTPGIYAYALAASSVRLAGVPVARDRAARLTLYRLASPARG